MIALGINSFKTGNAPERKINKPRNDSNSGYRGMVRFDSYTLTTWRNYTFLCETTSNLDFFCFGMKARVRLTRFSFVEIFAGDKAVVSRKIVEEALVVGALEILETL